MQKHVLLRDLQPWIALTNGPAERDSGPTEVRADKSARGVKRGGPRPDTMVVERLRSAPSLEVYLNSPEGTEPEELLTDIYMPLEPR